MSKSFSLTGLPSDLLTDDREYIRRIAVDPQQTHRLAHRNRFMVRLQSDRDQ